MADMHRNRTLLTLLVYLIFASLSVSALVSLAGGHERYALVLAVTLPVLHFSMSLVGMAMNDRRALTSSLVHLVIVGDWLQGAALGVAANSVNRSNLDNEAVAAVFAHVLLILGQLVCFAKSWEFLDSNKYDQDSGDPLV